jgi:hypothetical protein
MQPVKASGWLNSGLSEADKKTLRAAGITPVNDIFFPLWGNRCPILLLFGGYGSGKSNFAETDLLEKARSSEYFKCYYGRKVLEDVRGSVHSKFISLIKDNHLHHEFDYSDQPNGSMVIKHKVTGNSFHPFGASKPDSLKSIDDPTHFFLEEMDQFSLNDFAVILSRLRTEKGHLQLYGAFNTEPVLPDHWIIKMFFPEKAKNQSEETQELMKLVDKMGVTKVFCNYTDNYFIDQQDYYDKLRLASGGDLVKLAAMANGEFGSYRGENPFASEYRPEKNESLEAIFRPQIPIRISIDFNLNPFAVTFSHIWRDSAGEHVHIFDELAVTGGSIPKMIDAINSRYGKYLYMAELTGDYMGMKGELSQRDNASLYIQLIRGLGMNKSQLKTVSNPTHENSRADVNFFLFKFPDFKVNPKTCQQTCMDLRTVQVDAFGSIIKRNRNDLTQRADHLDTFRYLINTYLKKWILQNTKKPQ